MAPRLLAPLSSGSDSSKAEEIPDAAPVQQETFSVSLGPDRAGTTVFSSKVSGELITSVVADAEGNASLSGHGYQLKKLGDYSWEDSAGIHNWTFVAPNSVGLANYPETPEGMIPAEPTFAFMDLSVHDYDDIEGYAMALAAIRAAWEYGPPDSFFENGGTLSSSTLFSFSSSANRELNEVLDHLAPHSTHIRLDAPLAKASNAENGATVR